jgi:hypothetical protein
MSRPIARLSSADEAFNHSRTGSCPLADRQNASGIGFNRLIIPRRNVP